jgi:hypothetical protein
LIKDDINYLIIFFIKFFINFLRLEPTLGTQGRKTNVLHTRTLAPRVRAPTLGTPDPAGIWKQGESPPTPKIRKNSIKIRKNKKLL